MSVQTGDRFFILMLCFAALGLSLLVIGFFSSVDGLKIVGAVCIIVVFALYVGFLFLRYRPLLNTQQESKERKT